MKVGKAAYGATGQNLYLSSGGPVNKRTLSNISFSPTILYLTHYCSEMILVPVTIYLGVLFVEERDLVLGH